MRIIVLIGLLLFAGEAFAAVPANPTPAIAQPVGATRFYSQFELHQAAAYRSEPGTFRESPGSGGDSGGGAGASE